MHAVLTRWCACGTYTLVCVWRLLVILFRSACRQCPCCNTPSSSTCAVHPTVPAVVASRDLRVFTSQHDTLSPRLSLPAFVSSKIQTNWQTARHTRGQRRRHRIPHPRRIINRNPALHPHCCLLPAQGHPPSSLILNNKHPRRVSSASRTIPVNVYWSLIPAAGF